MVQSRGLSLCSALRLNTCLPYLCLERSSPSIDHKHKDFQGPGSKHNLGIKLKVKF